MKYQDPLLEKPIYQRIYDTVRQIPEGKVASYGQVARVTGGCTPRMVGYALAALRNSSETEDIPWQRVINSGGKISLHGGGFGSNIQRQFLEQEGVMFDEQGKVDFARFGWSGPGFSG